ncbi:MAG TPA: S41 family peptidase [Fulvivirga sp.]|nr:S41 family peptidase [Fulvivirga sp.]
MDKKIKTVIITLFTLLVQISVFGQRIAKDQAVEDLTILRDNIQQYNPALEQYNLKFDSLSMEIIQSLQKDSISIFDYFSLVSEICALSNEGHFTLGDWQDSIHKCIPESKCPYLPVSVKLISNQLYVWEDYSNEKSLNRGDKIISINGKTTDDIIKELQKVTPSDGDILTFSNKNIEAGFPWLYYFYIEQTNTFHFEYMRQNEDVKKADIQALLKLEQISNFKKYYGNEVNGQETELNAFYELQLKEQYAVLKLPSFDYRQVNQYKVKSKKMYNSIFKELIDNRVNHLVVDLRNNTGGRNEFADDMIPFILKPINTDLFLKKTISWEGKERTYEMPKASKYAFQGTVYVLVNGKTYSAGSSLARFLKEYVDAIIIGEETGTRYEGFSAGSIQSVVLPNTKLRIGIPRYHIFYPESEIQNTLNRGVLPDYEIVYSFEEIANEIDLHLEKALSLIKTK